MTAHPEATFGRVNAPEVAGVDCAAMRSVEAHARHLDYLMEHLLVLRHDSVATTDPHETELEWEKVRQWLAMVAGLRYVDVVPIGNNYWGLCERADEYEGAKNDLVSDVATEETRLLYAWGADRAPDARAPTAHRV